MAAGVRIALVKRSVRVAGQIVGAGPDHPHVGEAKIAREPGLIVQRLLKQHLGIEKDHRSRRGDRRHKVQQRHALRPEGGNQRNPTRHVAEQRLAQHFLRVQTFVLGAEENGLARRVKIGEGGEAHPRASRLASRILRAPG